MNRRSIQYYIQCFDRLNCDKSKNMGTAPHKPILLMSIMRLYETGCL